MFSSTTITINGVTQTFGSGSYGYAATNDLSPCQTCFPKYQSHLQVVDELLPNFNLQMWDYSLRFTAPYQITTNYDYTLNPLVDNPSNGILQAGVGG